MTPTAALKRIWRPLFRSVASLAAVARHYRSAVIPTGFLAGALRGLPRYFNDRRAYAGMPGAEKLRRYDDNPQLRDWMPSSPFDPHYTYQDAWAAREIHRRSPAQHVDVGSRITFVIGLAAFVRTIFIDLRPLDVDIPNLDTRAGTILDMPFGDGELESVSCLHVAEHIGLGRYGDPLDPDGTRKAARELARVLAPGGSLYFSLPVGRARTEFNAHRVHDPRAVPGLFPGLRLASFAAVGDDGRYLVDARPEDLAGADWSCGMYLFTRG